MAFLKEHKLSVIFGAVVLVLLVLFSRAYVFKNKNTHGLGSQEITLEQIKTLIVKEKDCATAIPKLQSLISQYPTFAGAFHWLGVCQFQSGNMTAAKVAFEEALRLDANNEASQNYLHIINANSGASISFEGQNTLTREEFETALGISVDPATFSLVRVAVLPASEAGKSIAAFYKSSLSTLAVQEYFVSAFKKSGMDTTVKVFGGKTMLSSSASGTTYSVTIEKDASSVYVTVMFTKSK